jgi:predicted metal-dependent hydrolase
VSSKAEKISELVQKYQISSTLDPHYAIFFELFNEGKFYESHDVLEQLWLKQKNQPNYSFYKGLIQLAGAFVHLTKDRLKPSAALFKLARTNLQKYPAIHESFEVTLVIEEIDRWLQYLEGPDFQMNPLKNHAAPKLRLTKP